MSLVMNILILKLKLLDLQLIRTFAASLWPLFNYINEFLLCEEEEQGIGQTCLQFNALAQQIYVTEILFSRDVWTLQRCSSIQNYEVAVQYTFHNTLKINKEKLFNFPQNKSKPKFKCYCVIKVKKHHKKNNPYRQGKCFDYLTPKITCQN